MAILTNLMTESQFLTGSTKTVTRIYDGITDNYKSSTGSHIIYLRAKISSTNIAGLMLRFWNSSQSFLGQTYNGLRIFNDETISVRHSMDNATYTDVSYQSIVDGVSNNLTISNTVWLDLTASYGAGNEPTKEWCDDNIPYFTGTYELTPWKTANSLYIKTNGEYKAVSWIQPASDHVVTTIKCDSNLKIRFKATVNGVTGGIIFGNCDISDSSDWRIFNYNSKIYLDIGSGRKYGSSMTSGSTYEWEVGNLYVKNLQTGSNLISGSTQTWTPSRTIYLYIETRPPIYYLEAYSGNTLTQRYIPMIRTSDNRAGLYDMVNNVFLDTGEGTTYGGTPTAWMKVSSLYVKTGASTWNQCSVSKIKTY